ncbi:MAG: hypothetical protein GYB65_14940 [Chloroflexi bacterium]|nr:hypothetical protein [Chloroflexota bacterium]
MSWETPRTWVAGELVTATLLNTHLRNNLNALKAPPSAHVEPVKATYYTTSSTVFVDVDGGLLSLSLYTNGGDVMVHFSGTLAHSAATGRFFLDVELDGERIGGDDGLLVGEGIPVQPMSFTHLVTGLPAGEHDFRLQWKTTAAYAGLFAADGATNANVHPQFWVREVS